MATQTIAAAMSRLLFIMDKAHHILNATDNKKLPWLIGAFHAIGSPQMDLLSLHIFYSFGSGSLP